MNSDKLLFHDFSTESSRQMSSAGGIFQKSPVILACNFSVWIVVKTSDFHTVLTMSERIHISLRTRNYTIKVCVYTGIVYLMTLSVSHGMWYLLVELLLNKELGKM
jgi:hypothetical protein